MKKSIFTNLLIAISIGVVVVSCEPNNDEPEVKIKPGSAVFISNEGNYKKINGSVSYYDITTNNLLVDPYKTTNGESAGDVVQSFSVVSDNLGLIVVNNSNKVKLVNLVTFKLLNTCEITYPRYALQISDSKVYVTQGSGKGQVKVLNPKTMTVTDSIKVNNGPEHLVRTGDYVIVANSGGWGQDSTVSIIDVKTDKVVKTLVAGQNPINLTVDADGNAWVLCKGSYEYAADYSTISGQSSLAKIDIKTLTITESIKIGKVKDSYLPIQLSISPDKKLLYFTEVEGVYTYEIASKIISKNPIIKGDINGMNVNPTNGDIYTFKLTDFSSPGMMYIYDNKGVEKIKKQVGFNPNGAIFY